MKKNWILHELEKKMKLKIELPSHELYKPVDRLGLPNNLVNQLIRGIMSFVII